MACTVRMVVLWRFMAAVVWEAEHTGVGGWLGGGLGGWVYLCLHLGKRQYRWLGSAVWQ